MGAFLTDQQIADYHRDGFLVLPDFAKPSACVALKAQAEKILHNFDPDANRSVFTTNEQSRHADQQFIDSATGIICFFEEEAFDDAGALKQSKELSINKIGHAMHDLDPVFEDFSHSTRLAAVADSVGLKQPQLLQSMYIFKQPRIGGEVTCHVDHTYLWTEPQSVIGFWFAIDDATTQNGCMWALPGGHRIPVKTRNRLTPDRKSTFNEVFDSTPYPTEGLVPLEAERGTLILLNGTLPHRSGPNTSDKPRHAYTIHAIDGTANYPDDNWLQRKSLPMSGFLN